jgi:ArsR family transcriptional regulator
MKTLLQNPAPAERGATVSGRALHELVELLKQLGDPSRLTIVLALVEHGELSVAALCDLLHQSQSAVSHHLATLRLVGLIECRRATRRSVYRFRSAYVANLVERGLKLAAGGPALEGQGFTLTFTRRR